MPQPRRPSTALRHKRLELCGLCCPRPGLHGHCQGARSIGEGQAGTPPTAAQRHGRPPGTCCALCAVQAYKAKFRNLHFNLKDAANPDLRRKVRRSLRCALCAVRRCRPHAARPEARRCALALERAGWFQGMHVAPPCISQVL